MADAHRTSASVFVCVLVSVVATDLYDRAVSTRCGGIESGWGEGGDARFVALLVSACLCEWRMQGERPQNEKREVAAGGGGQRENEKMCGCVLVCVCVCVSERCLLSGKVRVYRWLRAHTRAGLRGREMLPPSDTLGIVTEKGRDTFTRSRRTQRSRQH